MDIDQYATSFSEEPGYLDFARIGPIGTTVNEEQRALGDILGRARFGTMGSLNELDPRVREAVSALIGFPADQISFQPNTSQGLMHTMFGITGGIAMSAGGYPSNTFAAVRAAESLGVLTPTWIDTDEGRITPGNLKGQLTKDITAVAVNLVDFRTGYLADIEGIRQVIGDRLLILDAVQGFGIVDVPYGVADVVVSGGQTWARAGWGTGFLALSERALERLTPVFSGFTASEFEGLPLDVVYPPAHTARAFTVGHPDPIAEGRLAVALEEIANVGVANIRASILEKTSRIIDSADEFGIPVSSSRDEAERAGIVVLQPDPDQLTVLTAALYNHGVTVTTREGTIRLSAHVSTSEETFEMLRASFTSFASAINV
jgi:selenocysteine lyase/cysteine desulfurase